MKPTLRHTSALRLLAPLALGVMLSACAVGPDYVRPASELPTLYPLADGGQIKSDRQWWSQFKDPVLDGLVSQALNQNKDLKLAIARVLEAQASSSEVRALLFPQVDLDVAGRNTRASSKGFDFGGNLPAHRETRSAALSTAYEIDIWGRSRRATEAARARLAASEFGRDAVALSVAAMVSQNYFALRSLDESVRLMSQSRAAQQRTRDLVKLRADAGLASALDLSRADSALAALDAQLAGLREQRALREHVLGLLTGQPALVLSPKDISSLGVPAVPPPGLPADLVERRPDVRQAEQVLIAANAGVGLAKAAYFPRLTLTGRAGLESQDLATLLDGGTSTSVIGVGLSLPILDFGKTASQVEGARARKDQSWIQYQNALLVAFKEVRDGFGSLAQRLDAEAAQVTRLSSAEKALALARLRHEAGYSSALEVLDAERSFNEAAMAVADARRARLSAAVDVFKALGGGWTAP